MNPASRINRSNYSNLNGLRLKIISSLKQDPTYQEAAKESFKVLSMKFKSQASSSMKSKSLRPNSVPHSNNVVKFNGIDTTTKTKVRSNSLSKGRLKMRSDFNNDSKDSGKFPPIPKDYIVSLESAISRLPRERNDKFGNSPSLIPRPK